MSCKGQVGDGFVALAVVVIGLIIFAPFMLKVFISVQEPFSAQLGNLSGGAQAQANFNAVMNPAITWWDKVIVTAYVASILVLFISSFLIDTHPLFMIFYILVGFCLFLFSPFIIEAANVIYESSQFATEVSHLEWVDFIRLHYYELLLGVFFLNGVIMYGKVAFFPKDGGVVR